MSAPVPTADIGCDLVKISASGPMPTSRYCDHTRCSISASLSRAASGDPGRTARQVVADDRDDRLAHGLGLRRVAARLLLDDALEHARHEGHAGGLDRCEVAGREKPGRARVATVGAPNWRASPGCPRCAANRAPPGSPRPARRARAARDIVGATRDRSKTPSAVTRTSAGPSTPGRKARPTSRLSRGPKAGSPRASTAVESGSSVLSSPARDGPIIGGTRDPAVVFPAYLPLPRRPDRRESCGGLRWRWCRSSTMETRRTGCAPSTTTSWRRAGPTGSTTSGRRSRTTRRCSSASGARSSR